MEQLRRINEELKYDDKLYCIKDHNREDFSNTSGRFYKAAEVYYNTVYVTCDFCGMREASRELYFLKLNYELYVLKITILKGIIKLYFLQVNCMNIILRI